MIKRKGTTKENTWDRQYPPTPEKEIEAEISRREKEELLDLVRGDTIEKTPSNKRVIPIDSAIDGIGVVDNELRIGGTNAEVLEMLKSIIGMKAEYEEDDGGHWVVKISDDEAPLRKDKIGYSLFPYPIMIESEDGKERKAIGVRHTFDGFGFKVEPVDDDIVEVIFPDLEAIKLLQKHLSDAQVEQIIRGE